MDEPHVTGYSCFPSQYVVCRNNFDLGLMPLLPELRAYGNVHACLHCMAPPAVQNGPAASSSATSRGNRR